MINTIDNLTDLTKLLWTEEQVSTLAQLIHTNNARAITENVIRMAMALGALGLVRASERHLDPSMVDRLETLMGARVGWWR